jgi:hypothetical protein
VTTVLVFPFAGRGIDPAVPIRFRVSGFPSSLGSASRAIYRYTSVYSCLLPECSIRGALCDSLIREIAGSYAAIGKRSAVAQITVSETVGGIAYPRISHYLVPREMRSQMDRSAARVIASLEEAAEADALLRDKSFSVPTPTRRLLRRPSIASVSTFVNLINANMHFRHPALWLQDHLRGANSFPFLSLFISFSLPCQ